jgi:hypothetical protein
MSSSRALIAALAAGAALVLPDTAFAHVGKSAPVASNFAAHISALQPATDTVEAKVVDGDRELWLQVRPSATVLVPGAENEPVLRFDHGGVFVNLRSLTAQSDRIDTLDLRPDPDPKARPLWHRVSSGHSYRWHEHRLHILEPLARGLHTTTSVGRWSVPLLIDGHRHALMGMLVYNPPGSAWPWILLACGLAAIAAATLSVSAPLARRVAVFAALAGTLLVWMVRIGRELYGRPSVGVGGYIELALTSLVGIVLLWGLLYRDEEVRLFTAFLVGFGCLYQGLTMLPVITHAIALTTLPTALARPSVAAILGLGGGVLAITLREQFADAIRPARESESSRRRHRARPIRRSDAT